MRNFIVSDLHGNGFVYDSILNYLQNELEYGNDDITLHINGDLIDRGIDSGSMLVDIYDRITNHIGVNINYLGGNHELMMYKAYMATRDEELNKMFESYFSRSCHTWINRNSGYITANYLKKHCSRDEVVQLCNFVGNLNVYHKFIEQLNDKLILLVHACCVYPILDDKIIKIKDTSPEVDIAVWTRKDDFLSFGRVGNDKYFTIVGHTIVENEKGFKFDKKDNTLYIDGGAAAFGYLNTNYLYSHKNCFQQLEDVKIPFESYEEDFKKKLDAVSHIPLVEIEDNRLKILIFNHKNEIIDGYFFEDGVFYNIDSDYLDNCRKNLRENNKVKKRIRK